MRNSIQRVTFCILLIFIMIVIPPVPEIARSETSSWPSFFGSQDKPAGWARLVRGIGRGITGMGQVDAQKSTTAKKVAGLDDVEIILKSILPTRDVIMQVGGMRAGRNQNQFNAFMSYIEKDDALSWKQIVKNQTIRFARLPKSSQKLNWQIGNEINGKRFSETLRRWTGQPVRRVRNDPLVIPFYSEYFLAPTVEAIETASHEVFGSKGRINIVLGTIANAGSQGARHWLRELLEYRIQGTYARNLAGKKVRDLVNIVGVHYVATKDNESWESALDDLRKMTLGQGAIRGIWATEELGRKRGTRGMGASTALLVASRYLHWWIKHSMTPYEGRCSFWGWKRGEANTTGDDGLRTLYEFFGDVPLKEISEKISLIPRDELEFYGFKDALDTKRVIFVFPKPFKSSKQVRHILMKTNGWTGAVSSSMHIFSPKGHETLPTTDRLTDGVYTIVPSREVALRPGSAGMLLLEKTN